MDIAHAYSIVWLSRLANLFQTLAERSFFGLAMLFLPVFIIRTIDDQCRVNNLGIGTKYSAKSEFYTALLMQSIG